MKPLAPGTISRHLCLSAESPVASHLHHALALLPHLGAGRFAERKTIGVHQVGEATNAADLRQHVTSLNVFLAGLLAVDQPLKLNQFALNCRDERYLPVVRHDQWSPCIVILLAIRSALATYSAVNINARLLRVDKYLQATCAAAK